MVISIVVAVLWLKACGISIESLSVGEASVALGSRQDSVSKQVAQIVPQLEDLRTQLDEMQARLAPPPPSISDSIERKRFESSQVVSDQTAMIATPVLGAGKTLLKGQAGFIWIGNLESPAGKQILNPKLAQVEGSPTTDRASVQQGALFRVTGNMVLRSAEPKNDRDYYRGIPSLGVIPRGTQVVAAGAPIAIDREWATQLWLRVQVVQ